MDNFANLRLYLLDPTKYTIYICYFCHHDNILIMEIMYIYTDTHSFTIGGVNGMKNKK